MYPAWYKFLTWFYFKLHKCDHVERNNIRLSLKAACIKRKMCALYSWCFTNYKDYPEKTWYPKKKMCTGHHLSQVFFFWSPDILGRVRVKLTLPWQIEGMQNTIFDDCEIICDDLWNHLWWSVKVAEHFDLKY